MEGMHESIQIRFIYWYSFIDKFQVIFLNDY